MASAGFGARNAATPGAAPPKLTKEGPNGASLSRMGSPQDGEALRKGWKADLKASGKIEGNKWWIIDPRKNEHVGQRKHTAGRSPAVRYTENPFFSSKFKRFH